jgi:hypothetical protein
LKDVQTSGFTLERVIWKEVNPVLGIEHVYVPPVAYVGGGLPAALPSFCSALISIRTALGGKSHRGRMYLAGLPENQTVNSALDTAQPFWAALLAFAVCLATKFIQGDLPAINTFQFMVYSRKLGGSTFPYQNAGFTPVSQFVAVQQIATTRSRKVGRGS